MENEEEPFTRAHFEKAGYIVKIFGMDPNDDDDEEFDPIPRLLDGMYASLIGILAVFPLDVIKTRQQMTRPGEPTCAGLYQCGYAIWKREGIRGLYRGAVIVLVMTAPEKAVKQVCNDYFRLSFLNQSEKSSVFKEIAAGMVAGFLPVIISGPTDTIKTQLQDAGRLGKPKMSSRAVLKQTFRNYGITGLYAGLGASIIREIIFAAGYFPLMEHFRSSGFFGPSVKTEEHPSVATCTFVSGFLAASLMAWITTPLEVLSTRLQVSHALLLTPKLGITILSKAVDRVVDPSTKTHIKEKLSQLAGNHRFSEKLESKHTLENDRDGKPSDSTRHLQRKIEKAGLEEQSYDKTVIPRKFRIRMKISPPSSFHLPSEKPTRYYSPTHQGAVNMKMQKPTDKSIKKPAASPSSPSPMYYDTRVNPAKIIIDSSPSVGSASRDPRSFVSSPSVGAIRRQPAPGKDPFREHILEETASGWGHTEHSATKKAPSPAVQPKEKFLTARMLYRVLNAQGIKAMFRGAVCRVAVIAPRMAISQMVYSQQIFGRFLKE